MNYREYSRINWKIAITQWTSRSSDHVTYLNYTHETNPLYMTLTVKKIVNKNSNKSQAGAHDPSVTKQENIYWLSNKSKVMIR